MKQPSKRKCYTLPVYPELMAVHLKIGAGWVREFHFPLFRQGRTIRVPGYM